MREREYIRAVLRASGLPGSVRRRLRADLESDFAARRAGGQSEQEIIAAMGPPDQLAGELRESFAPRTRTRREKWALALAVVFGLLLLAGLIWLLAEQLVLGTLLGALTGATGPVGGVGVIGGADGPTAVFVSTGTLSLPLGLLALLLLGAVLCLGLYRYWRKQR